MIRYHSQKQLSLAEFDWPFQTALDENNRWVKLSECIPWDELAEGYTQGLAETQGRPTKDARLVIGAVIIKHKLCLSDRETVAQIQENPYLQYFVGLPGYQMEPPFVPSLFVEIRKRMPDHDYTIFGAQSRGLYTRYTWLHTHPPGYACRFNTDSAASLLWWESHGKPYSPTG